MKIIQFLKNRKIFFLLFFFFSIFNHIDSKNRCKSNTLVFSSKFCTKTTRGLEIRYIISLEKLDKEKDEIIIDGIKYLLFKTRESAIESVKYNSLKKDYTIVYVISDIKRNTEIISIPEEDN